MDQSTTSDQVRQTHLRFLRQTIELAQLSPPKPTNFRVGCVITASNSTAEVQVLSTGYTLELTGNTHAEQCALTKLVDRHGIAEQDLAQVLPPDSRVTLYTSLEPCGKRLSGNLPCVQRIINTRRGPPGSGIQKVVFGAKEPGTFVRDSQSCKILTDAGVEWEYVPDFENKILQVAMEGHDRSTTAPKSSQQGSVEGRSKVGNGIDDISEEERRRQEAIPRNPKKRMMDVL